MFYGVGWIRVGCGEVKYGVGCGEVKYGVGCGEVKYRVGCGEVKHQSAKDESQHTLALHIMQIIQHFSTFTHPFFHDRMCILCTVLHAYLFNNTDDKQRNTTTPETTHFP